MGIPNMGPRIGALLLGSEGSIDKPGIKNGLILYSSSFIKRLYFRLSFVRLVFLNFILTLTPKFIKIRSH